MNNRRDFQNLPSDKNPQFLEDGKSIYAQMKQKYPKKTHEDLDNILNGLCAALTCLMFDNVSKDDHKAFLQIIYKLLDGNI